MAMSDISPSPCTNPTHGVEGGDVGYHSLPTHIANLVSWKRGWRGGDVGHHPLPTHTASLVDWQRGWRGGDAQHRPPTPMHWIECNPMHGGREAMSGITPSPPTVPVRMHSNIWGWQRGWRGGDAWHHPLPPCIRLQSNAWRGGGRLQSNAWRGGGWCWASPCVLPTVGAQTHLNINFFILIFKCYLVYF